MAFPEKYRFAALNGTKNRTVITRTSLAGIRSSESANVAVIGSKQERLKRGAQPPARLGTGSEWCERQVLIAGRDRKEKGRVLGWQIE